MSGRQNHYPSNEEADQGKMSTPSCRVNRTAKASSGQSGSRLRAVAISRSAMFRRRKTPLGLLAGNQLSDAFRHFHALEVGG